MGRFHGSNHHGPDEPSVWPRKLSIYIHLLKLVNIIQQEIFHMVSNVEIHKRLNKVSDNNRNG